MTATPRLDDLDAAAAAHALFLSGAFHPGPEDGLPAGTRTLVLLSPREPGFWAHLTAQPEWQDGKADPVDRWSLRVVGELATRFEGKAFFPFGGPPWHPFVGWAKASGRALTSPVQLLVHDVMGLFASYRGAIALTDRLALPVTAPAPCDTCQDRPCLTACPTGALAAGRYDVAACHAFLARPDGADCLGQGCGVRRACPASQSYGRLAEQSAYHMRLFHQ